MERRLAARLAGFALLGGLCCACDPPRDRAATADLVSAEQEAPPGTTPEERLDAMAKRLARGMLPDGPASKAELRQGAHRDQLLVLRGGNCYRVLAAGEDGIEDLDLLLFDPNGVLAQQDPAQDRFPTLGVQTDLCPPVSGAYRLQASLYKGDGAYAVRVYRTP